MANGRNKLHKGDAGRDAGGFVALPWSVLDCSAYAALSHPAKALLMEFARQFMRDNNGRLLCSMAYLGQRGWRSNDVITRAVRELVAAGFVHQTTQGHRPSKASWYAVTWRALDRHPGYDVGALESFQRGAYRLWAPATSAAKITPLTPPPGAEKNTSLTPSPGVVRASRAPSPGVEGPPTAPSPGAVVGGFGASSTPSPGDHLDKPSTVSTAKDVQDGEVVHRAATKPSPSSSARTTTRPPRRCRTDTSQRTLPPPDPTAQMELLLPIDGVMR